MAHAHGTPSSDGSSSSNGVSMVPYLHFAGGDFLYFKSWQPTSAGAIAGACIGLVFLALLERWLAATRSMLDGHWRRRYLQSIVVPSGYELSFPISRAFAITAGRDQVVTTHKIVSYPKRVSTDEGGFLQNDIQEISNESIKPKVVTIKSRFRTITPFIPAHDIPRGLLYALQMLIVYLLMLAIMTFQAAFFISIVLGLGIGEIVFGRVAGLTGTH
ncbi:hypothetical protein GALMADRAFT_131553 [Galerina marginata CBS 339.88]|uniref:Copper transport protein n=1 Tax=Galerina marginata (strain CBS 339.88) TaxID=685588 RepID=A0A067TNJ8_GALM3|nr:hypothetical protein GALMADRAFT_131553 [Galerina marginata CBS 339.88]